MRLKEYEPRIKSKTLNLKDPVEILPTTLHQLEEFTRLKLGSLKSLISKMDETSDDHTIKIEKLVLESKITESKIIKLIKDKKEKYEIVGLI
jgi:transcription-repair coupling factor (superfamily II helicase)